MLRNTRCLHPFIFSGIQGASTHSYSQEYKVPPPIHILRNTRCLHPFIFSGIQGASTHSYSQEYKVPPTHSYSIVSIVLYIYTVYILLFTNTYFRGQLNPNQFAGIKVRVTSKPEILRFCFTIFNINYR